MSELQPRSLTSYYLRRRIPIREHFSGWRRVAAVLLRRPPFRVTGSVEQWWNATSGMWETPAGSLVEPTP